MIHEQRTRSLYPYGSRRIDLAHGSGNHVTDTAGRTFLDLTSMHGVLPLGHGHPAIVEAIRRQSERMQHCTASFGNPPRDALLNALKLRTTDDYDAFLCNSGTESIEAAIKLAKFATKRDTIIAAFRGFHGRTCGATSITHKARYRDPFGRLLPNVRFVPYGKLEALSEQLDDRVAAVILEPVQGEGGVYPAPNGYLKAAQALCTKNGSLFVLDEIQTGIGRCGSWFASQHHEVQADLICVAKGLASGMPIGALLAHSRVPRWPAGSHGSTFGGNPISCAAALACLQTIESENLLHRVQARAAEWRDEIAATNSERIREVRGEGFLIGIELRESARPIQDAFQAEGVLVLTAGKQVLRILPPLNLPRNDQDRFTQHLFDALR